MAELVSTTRIGRSLGVHFNFGDTKPSGVVDDQIWSNSHSFKLALKVADANDSNKRLLKPQILTVLLNRLNCLLQVGNNGEFTNYSISA